jgi:hypothetical protein
MFHNGMPGRYPLLGTLPVTMTGVSVGKDDPALTDAEADADALYFRYIKYAPSPITNTHTTGGIRFRFMLITEPEAEPE